MIFLEHVINMIKDYSFCAQFLVSSNSLWNKYLYFNLKLYPPLPSREHLSIVIEFVRIPIHPLLFAFRPTCIIVHIWKIIWPGHLLECLMAWSWMAWYNLFKITKHTFSSWNFDTKTNNHDHSDIEIVDSITYCVNCQGKSSVCT